MDVLLQQNNEAQQTIQLLKDQLKILSGLAGMFLKWIKFWISKAILVAHGSLKSMSLNSVCKLLNLYNLLHLMNKSILDPGFP